MKEVRKMKKISLCLMLFFMVMNQACALDSIEEKYQDLAKSGLTLVEVKSVQKAKRLANLPLGCIYTKQYKLIWLDLLFYPFNIKHNKKEMIKEVNRMNMEATVKFYEN